MIYSKALASCSFVFHLIVLPGDGDGCAPRRMTKVAPTTTPDLSQGVLRKQNVFPIYINYCMLTLFAPIELQVHGCVFLFNS